MRKNISKSKQTFPKESCSKIQETIHQTNEPLTVIHTIARDMKLP